MFKTIKYRVEDQASHVDDCPTNNMDMERLMGKADQRLQKLQTLSAASRSIVLEKTKALRAAQESSSFRSFRKVVDERREKEMKWNEKVKERFASDAEKKQQAALGQERKRLALLEELKSSGGPFTNAEEVNNYLADGTLTEKEKQQRMKKELRFARESSTTLPKVDPIFRVQVSLAGNKRRDKTAAEFGSALMAYLGKKADRNLSEYNTFKQSLRDVVV